MAFKVFVSYSTLDLSVVNSIRAKLGVLGVDVFIAEYSVTPGENLSERILAEIRACDVFVLLWSSNSKSSDWVPQEIGVARGLDKFIVPMLLERNVLPPAFISGIKYVNIHSNEQAAMLTLQAVIMERLTLQHSQEQNNNLLLMLLVFGVLILLLNQD